MAEYIDKASLYQKIAELEDLARTRYLDTPSNSPCYMRYVTQLNERTKLKHIVADFPAANVAPVVPGQWIIGDGDDTFDVRCTACGFSEVFDVCGIDSVKAIAETMHYCPNCGAKMGERHG